MATNPFRADGEWLRAQFHAHSLASDGELPPEAVARQYAHQGFDVLTISDHWTMTKVDAPEGLLLVPGAELMVDPVAGPMCPEFLAIGIDDVPETPSGDPANWYPYERCHIKTFATFADGAAFVTEQGGATVLCHPGWSGLPQAAVEAAGMLDGIELWNAAAQRENDRGDSSYVWDLALDVGLSFTPFGTDDSHYPAFDVGDAWTMVRAADRSRDAVVAAIRAGHTYASNGPLVHDVIRDGDAVEVTCSPARDVWLHGGWEDGVGASAGPRGRLEDARILERDPRGLLTRVRFTPSDDPWLPKRGTRWWRVVVEDEHGRRAWTNVV
ncbi:MAG TPA: CehA/McbA family metallohydrolase [Actinomycetota bacterium]|nr:CehA/McbA family metallohydrolase [Actinomycetota bacterium]